MKQKVQLHCITKTATRLAPTERHKVHQNPKQTHFTPQVNARSVVGAKRSSERVAGWRSEQKPRGRECPKERRHVATVSVKRQKQHIKKCNRRAQNQ